MIRVGDLVRNTHGMYVGELGLVFRVEHRDRNQWTLKEDSATITIHYPHSPLLRVNIDDLEVISEGR